MDPPEEIALVLQARRELLLRVHRHQLRREDLEDCYGQATLEILTSAKQGRTTYATRRQTEVAIEQRFVSRIRDRRRALAGRSPIQAALERSLPLASSTEEEVDIVDVRAELETLVLARIELRRAQALIRELTPDQRLVLISQVALGMPSAEFCRRYSWTPEKYRKVSQRSRSHLRRLMRREETSVTTRAVPSDKGAGTHL